MRRGAGLAPPMYLSPVVMAVIPALPIFQLGLVLYPGERLPLHIFEPRYRDMLAYCLAHEAPFGIVLHNDGKLAAIGCTARIVRVINRYEDGRSDILVEGEKRFAIEQLLHDKSYLSADVRVREDQHSTPDESLRQRLITQHMKLVELAQRVLRPGQYDDVEHLSFFIAHNAGLNLEQKQQVLELDNEAARVGYLVNHLEQFLPLLY